MPRARNNPDFVEELHQFARMFYEQDSDCDQHEFLNKFGFAHYLSKPNQAQLSLQTLQKAVPHVNIDKVFALVDRNGNGMLDFWELITLLYVLDAKLYCDNCYEVTLGARMWCENCLNGKCYGVCLACFKSGNISHPHELYDDGHMLLKGLASKQKLEAPFQAMDPVEQMQLEQMARMNLQAELETLLSLPLPNSLESDATANLDIASKEELQEAFNVLDVDQNGFISAAEYRHVMLNHGLNFTLANVEHMIHEVDTNGDGQIDFAEFVKAEMTK